MSMVIQDQYQVSPLCVNCELCVAICPTKSIFAGGRHFVIDVDSCEGCGICADVCPVKAIFPIKPDVALINRT